MDSNGAKSPGTANPLPYVILLGSIYGSAIVSMRFSISQLHPIDMVTLRMGIAALIHVLLYIILPNRKWPRSPHLWLHAGFFGAVGTGLAILFMVIGLQYISSGVSSLLQTLSVVFTIILAHFFLADEHLTWKKVVGVLVAFSGAALLLLKGESGLSVLVRADWRGYAWVVSGIFLLSVGNVYARRFLHSTDSFDTTSIRMLGATAACLPLSFFITGLDLSRVNLVGVAVILYAALPGTFIMFYIYYYVIKRFGATSVSGLTYVSPVTATLLGALLLGEIITPIMILAMVLIFIGLALIE